MQDILSVVLSALSVLGSDGGVGADSVRGDQVEEELVDSEIVA